MKKTALSLLSSALFFTTSLFAGETGFQLSYRHMVAQEWYLYGIQPASELVGKSSDVLRIGYAELVSKKHSFLAGSYAGLFVDIDKQNDEFVAGIICLSLSLV